MKIVNSLSVVLLLMQFVSNADAADDKFDLQACLDMQSIKNSENELKCYKEAAQYWKALDEERNPLELMKPPHKGLASEWTPNKVPLIAYKRNYALVYAHSSQTNNMPTSPNPLNRVLSPSAVDKDNIKFQFSLKHNLLDFQQNGALWFGYTQLSFWQVYDVANSRPFRENNYEPEFIYSLRTFDLVPGSGPYQSILNFGVVHQSNGQSNPRSRSWNRLYIQSGLERDFDIESRLSMQLRWWHRVKEDPIKDDNPDITRFLGHGDIEVRYYFNKELEISAIGKAHSIQLDLATTWKLLERLSLVPLGEHNTNFHIQYFSGYGESLIDYNHKHNTWGLGLSFPFE